MAVANAHAARSTAPEQGPEPFRWSGEGRGELFLIVDADRLVRYAGPGVMQILGVGQDDVVQSDIVDMVHPDDLRRLTETFTSFGDAPGSATFSGARLRHSDGSWRVLEGVGIKVQDEHDRPVFMFSASDVTSRQRAH
jgi:PAS domain S-box-containing protein